VHVGQGLTQYRGARQARENEGQPQQILGRLAAPRISTPDFIHELQDGTRIWIIITEADRSVTTILLPEEY